MCVCSVLKQYLHLIRVGWTVVGADWKETLSSRTRTAIKANDRRKSSFSQGHPVNEQTNCLFRLIAPGISSALTCLLLVVKKKEELCARAKKRKSQAVKRRWDNQIDLDVSTEGFVFVSNTDDESKPANKQSRDCAQSLREDLEVECAATLFTFGQLEIEQGTELVCRETCCH